MAGTHVLYNLLIYGGLAEMAEELDTREDYKIQAESLKDAGNEAFKANNMMEAIDLYSQVCFGNVFLWLLIADNRCLCNYHRLSLSTRTTTWFTATDLLRT